VTCSPAVPQGVHSGSEALMVAGDRRSWSGCAAGAPADRRCAASGWASGITDRARPKFDLFAEEGDSEWRSRPTRVGWSRDLDTAAAIDFRARVLSELRSGRLDRLNAAMMFQPACLCCGRPLTDPASMAPWIGPECAGTSSLIAGIGKLIAHVRLSAAA
jgi:Family of unknown function (DUF6011)